MKLSTRIKISYIFVFVIPILLIVLVAAGSTPLRLRALQQRYDLDMTSYEMLLNPTSMLSHMNTTVMKELDRKRAGPACGHGVSGGYQHTSGRQQYVSYGDPGWGRDLFRTSGKG